MWLSPLGWSILFVTWSNSICQVEASPSPYDGHVDISQTLFSESLTTTTIEWESVETISCTNSTSTSCSPKTSTVTNVANTPVLDETTFTTIFETFTETSSCSTSSKLISTSSSWTTVTIVESITNVVSCSTCQNSLRTIFSLSTETLSSLVPVSTITASSPKASFTSASWTTRTVVESITNIVPCLHCANSLSTIVSLSTETLSSLIPVYTSTLASSLWTTATVVKSVTDTVQCSTCANSLSTRTALTTETLTSLAPISAPPKSVSWTTRTVEESITVVIPCSTCANSLRTVISLTTETKTSLAPDSAFPAPATSTTSKMKSLSIWGTPISESHVPSIFSSALSAISASIGSHTWSPVISYTSLEGSSSATGSKSAIDTTSSSWVASNIGTSAATAISSGSHTILSSDTTTTTWNTVPPKSTENSKTSDAAASSNKGVTSIRYTTTAGTSSHEVTTPVTKQTSTTDSTSVALASSISHTSSATYIATTSGSSAYSAAISTLSTSSIHDKSETDGMTSRSGTYSATISKSLDSSPTSTEKPIIPTFTIRSSSINWIPSVASGSSTATRLGASTDTPASSMNSLTKGVPTSTSTIVAISSSTHSIIGLPVGSDTSVMNSASIIGITVPVKSNSVTDTSSHALTGLSGSGTTVKGSSSSASKSGTLPPGSRRTTDISSRTDSAVATGGSKSDTTTPTGTPASSSVSSSGLSLSHSVSTTKSSSESGVVIPTTAKNSPSSHPGTTNGSPSSVSALPTSKQSLSGISSFMPTNTASKGVTITGLPDSSTSRPSNPSISIVVVSGITASYTATQIPSDATLTAALTTTTTDASGTAVGIIIYPSASGWGWAYPCILRCIAPPFPPQPSCPPIAASVLSCYGAATATVSDSITSTMTTLPPGFYTEATTNTMWTGNTWLTTNVGGHQTILPVLVGCKSCGSSGGGLVLWNLPELPNVEFIIPGFPGLPKFHLPCIKIFGIVIAGDCNPPKTDDDNDNSSQSSSYNTHTFSKASTSLPTSFPTVTSFSTTKTSSSACSITQTASDCSVICEASPPSDAPTVPCSTTCYSTVTGCSATGTTTTTTTASEFLCAQDNCPECTDYSVTADFTQTSYTCINCLPGTGLLSVAESTSTFSLTSSTASPSVTKRTLPVPSDIQLPNNQGIAKDVGKFMVDMMNQPGILKFMPRSSNTGGLQNAVMVNLRERALATVLTGLRGCSSVIVVSKEAFWISHFYETPSFMANNAVFGVQVLDAMDFGDGTDYMPGLRQFTGPGGVFAPETNPQAVIVTPLNLRGNIRYWDKVKQIQARLKSVVPGLKTLNADNDVAIYATYMPDRMDPMYANERRFVTGKVLIQYDPDEYAIYGDPEVDVCMIEQSAVLKVWVEDKPEPVLSMAWKGNNFQAPAQTSTEAPLQETTKKSTEQPTQASKLGRAIQSARGCSVSKITSQTIYPSAKSSTIATASNTSPTLTTIRSPTSTLATMANSLFCSPSPDPGSPPTGIPEDNIAKNVTDFCAAVDLFSDRSRPGCDGQHHDGILLSSNCKDAGNTNNGLAFEYPGVIEWLNVTLVQGKTFVINSSACNTAFETILRDCPPFIGHNFLMLPEKYGGSVVISDGAGGAANFSIYLAPANTPGRNGVPGCAHVVAKSLKNNALCAADYCNCGGTVAPLLTSTVSGSTISNCEYSTQPAAATCPPAPPTVTAVATVTTDTSVTVATTAMRTSSAIAPPVPEATCTAVANIANTVVTVWTNYITDNGSALQDKEMHNCPGLSDWAIFDEQKSFKSTDGTAWVSNHAFQFKLQLTHPQELNCVQKAIVAAGGPSNAPQCGFSPAISPP